VTATNDEETTMPPVSDNYGRASAYAAGDIAYGDAAATAQVSAMLAVADEIRALRAAIDELARNIRSVDEPPSGVSQIDDTSRSIAGRG
jgi:hypothetical protein